MARKLNRRQTTLVGMIPQEKKVRKKRKPMTEEQNKQRRRLEKARAVVYESYGQSSIHESLRDLPDDLPSIQRKLRSGLRHKKNLRQWSVEMRKG